MDIRARIQALKNPGDWLAWAGILAGIVLVTLLHYSAAPGLRSLHTVYRFFYFLPIVYAALRFGFWGGLLASLVASLLFAPHIFFKWDNFPSDSLNDLLVVVVFYGVAIITGVTTDQLRRAQAKQARTAAQLAASLHRLEEQGEELRRAERLSALGTLAGGLAHEIRNPVGIIRATAQLLRMECGPAAGETVAVIQEETERIEQLIQDLLNYARGQHLARQPVVIQELLRQVQERIRPLAETQGVTIRVESHPNIPTVVLDPEQLEQALVNLCVNAIQAMDGPGRLTLTAGWKAQAECPLELRVQDTGPGILPEEQQHIFDPFFTTKDTGTGLGLSVVQRIVDDHGGRVWVESIPGQGATFVIRLPG